MFDLVTTAPTHARACVLNGYNLDMLVLRTCRLLPFTQRVTRRIYSYRTLPLLPGFSGFFLVAAPHLRYGLRATPAVPLDRFCYALPFDVLPTPFYATRLLWLRTGFGCCLPYTTAHTGLPRYRAV